MGLFDKLKKSLFGTSSGESPVEKSADEKTTVDNQEQSNQESVNKDLTAKTDKKDTAEISKNINYDDEFVKKTRNDNQSLQESNDQDRTVETSPNNKQSNSTSGSNTEFDPDSFIQSTERSNLNSDIQVLDNSQEPNVDEVNEKREEQPIHSESEEKYQIGLKKSRNNFASSFNHFLAKFRKIDNQFFEDLEDFLIESDVGYELTMDLSDRLKELVKEENLKSKDQIGQAIISYLVDSYNVSAKDTNLKSDSGLNIYLFVGVNGAGKTTTIGKLANRLVEKGKKVILVAGDTFRAGATEQLERWAEKTGAEIVKGKTEQDPASLVFEGIHKAQTEGADYLLIDTAGRLQNKVNLMNELDKIKRTIKKESGSNPIETLLVIDATTGQNGLNQAREFNQVTKLSGLVLSKLDGTAKGGIVLQIKKTLDIPVKLVGLGEHVDDLVDFDPLEYMKGFFSGILKV